MEITKGKSTVNLRGLKGKKCYCGSVSLAAPRGGKTHEETNQCFLHSEDAFASAIRATKQFLEKRPEAVLCSEERKNTAEL